MKTVYHTSYLGRLFNLTLITTVLFVGSCRKPLRPASNLYDAKSKVNPLPFTLPLCSPVAAYVTVKKNGTTLYVLNFTSVGTNYSDEYRHFELRQQWGGNYYVNLNFIYLRPALSANYELMSRTTPQSDRGYNKVEFYGQVEINGQPGFLDSDKGDVVHAEYQSSGLYKITICDVPMTFKYNGSGLTEDVTVSLQFEKE